MRRWLYSLFLVSCSYAAAQVAPGAPGNMPTWTNGNKVGVGTANSTESKLWFTLGNGTLNEVYYPTVDKANTRSLEFLVTDGKTFSELESRDADFDIRTPDPAALIFTQVSTSRSKRWQLLKTYVADPERDVLLMQVQFKALKPMPAVRLYAVYDPSINNSGMHDSGYTSGASLVAADGGIASALTAEPAFTRTTSGYLGTSDGIADLLGKHSLLHTYARAADGNVVQIGELPVSASTAPITLALAFGKEGDAAVRSAQASLQKGFAAAEKQYADGWHQWVSTLKKVDAQFQTQYQFSAMLLKAHEDKTYRGAGAAALTVPWGNDTDASEPTVGGYHLVWARDLYQVASAMQAIGDKDSADRALNYLFTVQQKKDGSFPQNSWLNGKPFYDSLQLDEVAFPMVLAYQLGRTDPQTYESHVKPAANFVVSHGPASPQERWEEESGYSPSTIAAEIAGLVCAAEIAKDNHDENSATLWLAAADDWARKLESWTVTDNGPHSKERYFIRLTQHGKPDSGEKIEINNGGGTWDEREIMDAGFLELVRLGIRRADDPLIKHSLDVVDKVIRVETPRGPGWYRYNHDGYGEQADGKGYDEKGIGRLWILLAGERGEYLLAKGDRAGAIQMLETMQRMANAGHMIAEQVWDRAESPKPHLRFGEPTGSATPLAWSNAQFVRLAVALSEGKLPEQPQVVAQHFAAAHPTGGNNPARISVTPIPSERELKPGQKLQIGTVALGESVVVMSGDQVRRMDSGHIDIPVVVSDRPQRVSIAVRGGNGETAFEQMTIAPTAAAARALLYPSAPEPDPKEPKFAEELRSGKSPIVNGPWVTFVYRGPETDVEAVGEFTDWDRRGLKLEKEFGGTRYLSMQFPDDARIEYKFIVGKEWQLDALNPNKMDNGVGGENSFFTMPNYHPAAEKAEHPAKQGRIESAPVPDGSHEVSVYVPPGCDSGKQRCPSLYLGDGKDYLARAHAAVIADSLISAGKMKPIIIIFVQPKDRMAEYWMSDAYVDWLSNTLVPLIDSKYRTIATPAERAIGGASLGGLIAAYAAFHRPEVFGNVLGQSSALNVNGSRAAMEYASAERRPLRIYLEVGRYEGLLPVNREIRDTLQAKGYDFAYREISQGHNWTHWADALPQALEYLFPTR